MGLRSDDIVLGPEQLHILRGVFDAAWEECAPDYDLSPTSIEIGRVRLANALLSARREVGDAETIKAVVLRRMAMWRHESRIAL
jgi:hypothetical protein